MIRRIVLLAVLAVALGCAGTTEADDMTMRKFPAARNLAEVVGQDRYLMANLAERLDGTIRRGVVSRVRPTGAGFEYTFPEGVDAVYLVDVEIYNPGARPVELQGIESAIPVRPGQGVRVLIPGGDITRGPIVMGRLTPAASEVVRPSATGTTEYPAIGANRVWIADIRVFNFRIDTDLSAPPNTPERYYPDTITWATNIVLSIEKADGGTFRILLPFHILLHMVPVGGNVSYLANTEFQHIIEIEEPSDIGARDLTPDMPTDLRGMEVEIQPGGTLFQASYHGNQELERVTSGNPALAGGTATVRLSELGVGTK